MDFKVEKNIPLPISNYGFLDSLEINDSVLLPEGTNINSMLASVAYRRQRYGKKFKRRRSVEGVRIWRVS